MKSLVLFVHLCSIRPGLVHRHLAMAGLLLLLTGVAGAAPVTGKPVPGLAAFDSAMQQFMTQYGVGAGVLAVSRNDTIVYQRGFGSKVVGSQAIGLPENTPMRVASLTKPIAAAAVRHLVARNVICLQQRVFNLGQPSGGPCVPAGGILSITPWQGLGAGKGGKTAADITVDDLLKHRGGWSNEGIGFDPVFRTVAIAQSMGVPSPAGRLRIAQWLLHQPLNYTPGTLGCVAAPGNQPISCYFNAGYMLLGMIVEQVSGLSCEEYVRRNVLTPNQWVPATDIFAGHTFAVNQSPREPLYYSPSLGQNVYSPLGPQVSSPYGGWDMESFVGFGNVVASAAPLLTYMNNYEVWYPNIGTPLNGSSPSGGAHAGGLTGTATIMWPRTDGINIVVLFAKSQATADACQHLACSMASTINQLINNGGLTWPTQSVDGFWVDFQFMGLNYYGAYDHPFGSMNAALGYVANGSKLRLKPGTSTWTGTINRKLLLDAPLGAARIGG